MKRKGTLLKTRHNFYLWNFVQHIFTGRGIKFYCTIFLVSNKGRILVEFSTKAIDSLIVSLGFLFILCSFIYVEL